LTVKSNNLRENLLKIMLIAAFFYVGVQAIIQSNQISGKEKNGEGWDTVLFIGLAEELEESLYNQFMPGIVLAKEQSMRTNWLVQEQINSLTPLYGYFAVDISEAQRTKRAGNIQQEVPETSENVGEETSSQLGETGELTELLMAENQAAMLEGNLAGGTEMSNPVEDGTGEQAELIPGQDFISHEKIAQIDTKLLGEYETLLKHFYTVDANTSTGSERLNAESFMQKDMTITKEGEGPQILIFHTHSQEGFADSVPGDESTTILGVGEYLKQVLEENYGYQVLHHTGKYDVESRNDAYSEALPEIERVLSENPSIQVVIDLHRDSMPEETKLVMDLDGRPTARFMFFNGLSRTRTTGNISYLHNENLDVNLAFSFQMQLKAAEYYPGLTRKIYLKGYRYNMHLKDKFLLVELGAQNNTLEEAKNACDPLAHILDMVLSGEGG